VILQAMHEEYRDLDLGSLRGCRVFLDGRGAFSRERVEAAGMLYIGIGSGNQSGALLLRPFDGAQARQAQHALRQVVLEPESAEFLQTPRGYARQYTRLPVSPRRRGEVG